VSFVVYGRNVKETIYGRNAVYEMLRANRRQVYRLMVAQGVQERGHLADALRLAQQRSILVQRVKRDALDRITDSHQGIVAEVEAYPYVTIDDILDLARRRNEPPLILILDVIQNPQNLGTLLRTAEAVGAHGVIIPQRRGVEVTQAVVNASSGASEHLLIAQVVNLVMAITGLKEQDVWVTGLDNLPEARSLDQADLSGAVALVVGNEGEGMRRLVRESCDFLVKLPMRGQVDSLNAAVAGSIVLYEILRQRMKAPLKQPASTD
jgi:23S rRNA (guanosine2251-2'-O)-methyltransferase